MTSVLDGIRVLDLSWGIAGPITGMLLADHGADVVKIEPPGGDPFRGTPGYDAWLRGRRSAELDLRDAGRPRRVPRPRDAMPTCVLESFAPGTDATARHRRRDAARRATRGSSTARSPPYGRASRHTGPSRLRRARRGAPRHHARAARPLRRPDPAA